MPQAELANNQLRLEHSSLKDRATAVLRDAIITGKLAPGSKLPEREVAKLLGTSKAPARDALLALEKEGLVVSKKDARYVQEFSLKSIRALFAVRRPLEKLALEFACQNPDRRLHALLLEKLADMRDAVSRGDHKAYRESDLETHRIIWRLADNPFLLQTLESLVGPIFMFIAVNASSFRQWDIVLESHEEIISNILHGNATAAVKSMDENLSRTFSHIVETLGEEHAPGDSTSHAPRAVDSAIRVVAKRTDTSDTGLASVDQ